MTKTNIKASNSTMFDELYKLSDFIPEFAKFRSSDDKSAIGCDSIDNSLFVSTRNGDKYFKPVNILCPQCNSRNVVKNGTVTRKLIFLRIGEQKCVVQKYKCNNCGKIIYTDLSSIVNENSNITLPVIEHIQYLYSIFSGSLHKIRKSLKKEHNIEISHQSIENIILGSNYEIEHENWSYSGYYLFDSLWVKEGGKWKYLYALFDLGLNTIVSKELVDSETIDNAHDFLKRSLRNQDISCIITDLKFEYRVAIDRLKAKQQFCIFHAKQHINREIRNFIRENAISDDDKDTILHYKELMFGIIDAESIEEAKDYRNELFSVKDDLPDVVVNLTWDLMIPEFKKFTNHLEDDNIVLTSNKIENCFLKNFPKHIKKIFKSKIGILKRFDLKLMIWDENNANF